MRTLFRTWLAFSAMAMALAGPLDAQDASAFDAIYTGVSSIATGGGKCRPVSSIPRPLRISGGKAHLLMGANGEQVFDGPVRIDGSFTLIDESGREMTGRIDAMGAVTASVADSAAACTYVMTWRYE